MGLEWKAQFFMQNYEESKGTNLGDFIVVRVIVDLLPILRASQMLFVQSNMNMGPYGMIQVVSWFDINYETFH